MLLIQKMTGKKWFDWEDDDWTIHLSSGEDLTLDESFDFDRLLWE